MDTRQLGAQTGAPLGMEGVAFRGALAVLGMARARAAPMTEPSLIHVAGPPEAGKTALIEAVLARSDEPVLVARCIPISGSRTKESAPRSDRELQRLRRAGAAAVARYSFPPERDVFVDFFETGLMLNLSQAVILEGGDPLGSYDLRVFVAPTPAAGETVPPECP